MIAKINSFGATMLEFNAGSASYFICHHCLNFPICKMGKQ